MKRLSVALLVSLAFPAGQTVAMETAKPTNIIPTATVAEADQQDASISEESSAALADASQEQPASVPTGGDNESYEDTYDDTDGYGYGADYNNPYTEEYYEQYEGAGSNATETENAESNTVVTDETEAIEVEASETSSDDSYEAYREDDDYTDDYDASHDDSYEEGEEDSAADVEVTKDEAVESTEQAEVDEFQPTYGPEPYDDRDASIEHESIDGDESPAEAATVESETVNTEQSTGDAQPSELDEQTDPEAWYDDALQEPSDEDDDYEGNDYGYEYENPYGDGYEAVEANDPQQAAPAAELVEEDPVYADENENGEQFGYEAEYGDDGSHEYEAYDDETIPGYYEDAETSYDDDAHYDYDADYAADYDREGVYYGDDSYIDDEQSDDNSTSDGGYYGDSSNEADDDDQYEQSPAHKAQGPSDPFDGAEVVPAKNNAADTSSPATAIVEFARMLRRLASASQPKFDVPMRFTGAETIEVTRHGASDPSRYIFPRDWQGCDEYEGCGQPDTAGVGDSGVGGEGETLSESVLRAWQQARRLMDTFPGEVMKVNR